MKGRDLILNPFFLSGLALLIANDLFFKWHFANALTGKLSDFAGLFILPIFIAYFLPKSKKNIALLIGFLFILWKSPISTPLIEFVNSISSIPFKRVIDYSDLIALSVLPFSHIMINKETFKVSYPRGLYRYLRIATLLVASFSFVATSMVTHGDPDGTIYLGNSYVVKMSKDSLLNKIHALGYQWTFFEDTLAKPYYQHFASYYQIENVLIKEEGATIDTLKSMKFGLEKLKENKTRIHLMNVVLRNPEDIENWNYLRKIRKNYMRQVKEFYRNEVKEEVFGEKG